jgi:hypothetical protein
MFNKRFLPMILVVLMLFAAGCGSKTASTDSNGQNGATSATGSVDNTKQPVQPDSPPDMTGKVKAIEGNILTVYKVNMPNNNRPPGNTQNSNTPPDENSKPQGQTANQGQGDPAKPRGEMFQVTDETVDLVIAADAKIVKRAGRAPNNNDTTQLSLGDIKTGDILMLWYGDKLSDGGQSVNSIQVMPSNN